MGYEHTPTAEIRTHWLNWVKDCATKKVGYNLYSLRKWVHEDRVGLEAAASIRGRLVVGTGAATSDHDPVNLDHGWNDASNDNLADEYDLNQPPVDSTQGVFNSGLFVCLLHLLTGCRV